MPSDSGSAWSPPASNSERRLSNSSDGSACSGYSKTTTDSADFLATRAHTAAVIPGKPAANPLQFVRVGPADLGSRAREQLRRAELAKRTEPKIEIQEDWQSNLDNWKSSRRKRVEHIIERCVEVRRMENEPTQPRAKSKTFNEMLEERAGRRRKNHLPLYTDDDGHDLSDLGIGTSSTKSSLSEDCDTHSLASDGIDLDKNHSDVDNLSNCDNNRKLGSSANEYDTCTTTTISSPEPEEYTYEGAIEGYKSRIISQTNSSIVKTVVNNNFKEKSPDKVNGDLNRIRTNVSNKIEEKLSSFQQERSNDVKNNNQKKDLPKVDIHKRREQFERENSQESQINKPKLPDIANKKSIKERLSSLEKFTEETHVQKSTSDLTKLPTEVKPLKERLSSLEKVKSASVEPDRAKRLSNGDLSNAKSLRERLSSLKSQTSEEEVKVTKTEVKEVSMSLKERLSCLDAAKNKDIPKISVEEELTHKDKVETKADIDSQDKMSDSSLKNSLSGIESQMQSFCRSLDSLDINGQSSPNSFERVQSLEDFDCAEMQNNTVPSDIETEDSGIHTARDSCVPPDDIADLTQVASPIGEPMVEVSEYESSNEDSGMPLEPTKLEEPMEQKVPETIQTIIQDIIIEEIEEQDSKAEDTDSGSNYIQAVSQPEELSVTEEVTEIQLDKEDEDTLKSLDNQDTSVSLNEPVSTASEGDTVVFEGKMTIHLNLNEICNNMKAGAGNNSNCNETSTTNDTNKSMPMVIDALELAFQELDSEDSMDESKAMDDSKVSASETKTESVDSKVETLIDFGTESKIPEPVPPLYENIDIFYQNSSDGAGAFPLDMPTNVLEPPKEKPPPPPTDDGQEDELLGNGNFKHTSSARRIKKEIRNKRTSFLGIEGQVDDSYLDADLTLAPRPDITSFLQEETKIEKLLYKKTLSHDMDAKLRESRDSGVDVDRGPSAEAWYKGQSSPETSSPHSRQNSEPYTQMTVTSDEEESTKKQKEQTFTNNLNTKLTELTESPQTDDKIDTLDKKIQQQQEVLRFERELLQLEQEELRRQRENLLRDQNRIIQKSVQDISTVPNTPEKPPLQRPGKSTNQNYRHSMPNLLINESYTPVVPAIPERPAFDENMKRKPFVSEEHIQRHFGVEESRKVLYEDRKIGEAVRRQVPSVRPPQPVLPPKPKTRESIEREITMRSSRVPSAVEYVNVDRTAVQLRQKPVANGNSAQYHPMTRHTLQALSAAPTPKLISNADWMQARQPPRKPAAYNYNQHWLIQEAEQRRIEESRSKLRAGQRHSYHQDMPAPQLQTMLPLSTSQQHLPTEFKRPLRSEVRPDPPRDRPEPRDRPDPPRDRPEQRPEREDKMLSVSGRRKCSHCGEELGRGAAMIIESLSLCYHVWCFTCAVCGARLGDGRAGADVRVRANRLHCYHCYSGDDGRKYSRV
ncbi:LIM domain only protein 7 isoform X2 [Ostrinia furnacalis]|uniref:LIM domain only protein 7 isoform X2 n=1 Tax=Ostrinia furnacalis TaxID=93504 RepID=UPI00103B4B3E|nr:LIM domain only protein 7 isoform X2 [Ostrinia furnacalis]